MAKGNPHKMHGGYKRNQQKATSASLLFDAQTEEREMFFEEMDADFDYDDFYDFHNSPEDDLTTLQDDFDFWDTLYLEDFGSVCDASHFLNE